MNTYYFYRHPSYSDSKHKIEFVEVGIFKIETEVDLVAKPRAIGSLGKVTASEKYIYREGKLVTKSSKATLAGHLYNYALTLEDAIKKKALAMVTARKAAAEDYADIVTKLESTINSADSFIVPIQTQYPELFL
jgi:hypothetical protein